MVEEKVFLTKEGLKKLQGELNNLNTVRRKEVAEKLLRAREMGDISENAAYEAAREEQAFVEGRAEELGAILRRVKLVSKEDKKGVISIGSTVRVHIDGGEHSFQIVGAMEADPTKGKISHESPLGQALIGKQVGERVEIEAPAGKLAYHILEIK
jgi:transcription elongation factor GreA